MTGTVLVAGASGLIGTATVDAFLAAGWNVIAASRRRPEVFSARDFTHLPLDLQDREACAQAAGTLRRVTHVVFAAVFEKPGLVRGWQEADQMQTNLAMLQNLIEPLSRTAALEHVTVLQGTKAYGVHLHPIRIPARERHPRDDHANFYWLQEDYIKAKAAEVGFAWTIFRPTVVLGPNVGVVMNVIPIVGLYAALCREEGLPFGFPGHVSFPREAVDCRLIANATVWAAVTPHAHGEHFNLTNGEVFSWRDLWPSMADFLGVDAAPDRPVSMAAFLPSRAAAWDRIVEKRGLRRLGMAQLLGESHHYADFGFGYGLQQMPAPAFVSTVKIRQAGFNETVDTEAAVRHWLGVLIERRILPR